MQNFNFEMYYLVRNLYINFSIYIVCITYLNILFTKKDCKYNIFLGGGGVQCSLCQSQIHQHCAKYIYI